MKINDEIDSVKFLMAPNSISITRRVIINVKCFLFFFSTPLVPFVDMYYQIEGSNIHQQRLYCFVHRFFLHYMSCLHKVINK